MELFNHLESSYKLVMTRYGISLTGELILKLRIISYDKKVYNKILNIPKDQIVKNYIPLYLLSFNDDSMPLSTDLNKYGEIINNEYVVNGEKIPGIHYHYKDNIIIFVHESDKVNERRLTVFKNNAKYIECVDIFNENTDVFIRKINDFTLYILIIQEIKFYTVKVLLIVNI